MFDSAWALGTLSAAEPGARLKLPDPLLTLGGDKVTTVEAWQKTRRPEECGARSGRTRGAWVGQG